MEGYFVQENCPDQHNRVSLRSTSKVHLSFSIIAFERIPHAVGRFFVQLPWLYFFSKR